MSLRFLPNLLCVLRMLLVYPVARAILDDRHQAVLLIFAIAAFTDGLDGFLAKRFGWSSELGKHLDPAADKLLLVTVFVCLSIAGLVPWWLTAIVLLRDIVIVVGAGIYRALFGPVRGEPTLQSKLNTVCQILFCLAVVSSAGFAWPTEPVIATLGALVFITTTVSGIDYVLIYSRRAAAVTRTRAAGAH